MRIAIVGLIRHPIAEPFAGGMESHTWWLAKKLIARGHDITLFASGDSDPRLGLNACAPISQSSNPKAQSLTGEQTYNMTAYAKVLKEICRGQFDIVHNNALYPLLLLSAADLPAPMLMVLHAIVYPELAAAMKYAMDRNASGNLTVSAVSKSVADQWRPIVNAEVVYNGVDINSWPFGTEPVPNLALWYGRIVPEKGTHIAIQAALAAGYSIRLAGPVSDRAYFAQHVQPLLAHKQVKYLGHLSHKEIKQVLMQASVLVNTPLWEEPYGIVYAEALAAGTPIATFNRGAASEILTPKCGVVVKERTTEALAIGIARAATLSRYDCRARAASFCSLESMIDGYERLYRQLIIRHQQRITLANRTSVAASSAPLGVAQTKVAR